MNTDEMSLRLRTVRAGIDRLRQYMARHDDHRLPDPESPDPGALLAMADELRAVEEALCARIRPSSMMREVGEANGRSQAPARIEQPFARDGLSIETLEGALMSRLPALIYIATPDLTSTILYANPHIESLLGYSQDEWLANSDRFPRLLHPDDRSRVMAMWASTVRTGAPFQCEYRLVARDGRIVWMEDRALAMCDEDGLVRAFQGVALDITERKQAEVALRASERRFRVLIEHSSDGIALLDPDGTIRYVNSATSHILGYSRDESMGRNWFALIHADDRDPAGMEDELLRHPGAIVTGQYRIRHKDGSWRWVEVNGHNMLNEPDMEAIVVNYHDITARKALETQFLRVQKTESVGQLAGGIAHDFNNLLTAILGYAELGMTALPDEAVAHGDFQEIRKAARRASGLVRQLLTFARKQVAELQVLCLNDSIAEMEKLLRRLAGEQIELEILAAPALGMVKADAGQIEQVLVNLVVNARDALPEGGRITIETANAELDESYARERPGVAPGAYVMLVVSDTGQGMSDDVKAHLFEPFFTTKEPGHGTGLGLATCYSIVKQHGGNIWVYSELGHGTSIKIYLPRVEHPAAPQQRLDDAVELPRGSETVLVVEDDAAVRGLAARVLRAQGYRVLDASNGKEALRAAIDHGKPIHVLLTDVVMPEMDGNTLAERIQVICPDIRVIFASGYAGSMMAHLGRITPRAAFLQKPFSTAGLICLVREVLDGQGQSTGGSRQ